ncbi:MAG: hypothetical protein GF317_20795 [Candidatus Lokiarchaeota archaeon]|nr:hypothetical protein [Candidatus Lokiarchaeota archaeon]
MEVNVQELYENQQLKEIYVRIRTKKKDIYKEKVNGHPLIKKKLKRGRAR